MKKIIALFSAGLMLSAVLSGCGASSTPTGDSSGTGGASPVSKEPTEIVIWHECDATIMDVLQKELDKLAPDIVVTVERKEKLPDTLKLVGNDPNSAPDLVFYAHDKIGVFAQTGILAPVTDFVDDSELTDLLPMTKEAGMYQGKRYQIPVYFETLLFMYNKALMTKVPKTTDELYEYMKANTKDGMYGFVEQHTTAYYTAGWMHGFGGYIINDKAEPGLNQQGTIDAVTYHKKFADLMPADADYNTITTLFKEGKAHATISGPWLVPDIRAAGIDLGIAAMPTIAQTGKAISPYSGVQGLFVLKTAENKKEAVAAVLKQVLKSDIGIALAKTAGSAPANQKCYDDADVSKNEIVMAMKAAAQNAVPMPNVPEMDVMWTVAENMLVAVNKNSADPKTEADKAQTEALDQIASMK